MKQTRTAREMLAQIEDVFFKGVNLAETSVLESEERRTFVLSQVERLLTEESGQSPLAMWLSDQFWTADEGRLPINKPNPLLSQRERQTLTDEELVRLQLIQEIAGLCHDISLHYTFDLMTLVSTLDERFAIKIDGTDILPENFANVSAIEALVQRSKKR